MGGRPLHSLRGTQQSTPCSGAATITPRFEATPNTSCPSTWPRHHLHHLYHRGLHHRAQSDGNGDGDGACDADAARGADGEQARVPEPSLNLP